MKSAKQTDPATYQMMRKLLPTMELPTYKTVYLQLTNNYALTNHYYT